MGIANTAVRYNKALRFGANLLAFLGIAFYIYALWKHVDQDSSGIILGCACIPRLALLATDIEAGRRAWQRAVIPVLTLAKATFHGRHEGLITWLILGLAEVATLVVLIVVFRRTSPESSDLLPEQRAAAYLSKFVPEAAARWIATEMVILWSAITALLRGFRIHRVTGFGYAEGATMAMLPVLVLIASPADFLLLRVLSHNRIVELVFFFLNIWGCLWCLGIYITMKLRPHTLAGEEIAVHQGILGHAKIPLRLVTHAKKIDGPIKGDSVANLSVHGSEMVMVSLAESVEVYKLFRGAPLKATGIIVSVNEPAKFIQKIFHLNVKNV